MNIFKHMEVCLMLSFGVLCAVAGTAKVPHAAPAQGQRQHAFAFHDLSQGMPVVMVWARRMSADEKRRDAGLSAQASSLN